MKKISIFFFVVLLTSLFSQKTLAADPAYLNNIMLQGFGWDEQSKHSTEGNYYKFTQNKNLKNKLLSTKGTILVEASPFDRVWGIGLDKSNPLVLNRESWRGSNWLGEVLTQLREDLLNDCKFTGIQRKNAKGNA